MNKRIGIAGAIWTASILLSRFVGLVRDRVLGSTLGTGPDADAYAAAFRIPDFMGILLTGGALSVVFIPIFSAHLERGEEEEGWKSFSNLANILLVAMGVLLPAIWWATPELVRWLAPGFDAEREALLVRLTRIILPAQVFHVVGSLLSAALLSRDRHTIPALAPLLYTLGIIGGGLIGGNAEGFAWGVLVGAAIGPFGLPLLENLRQGLRWRLILDLRHPDARPFLLRFTLAAAALSIAWWDDLALTHYASTLGEGATAQLNYAKTLMRVPMGVFGAAMGYAAYPTLTRLWLEKKPAEMWETLTTATRRVLFLAFGSQVVLSACGQDVATIIYTIRRIPPEMMEVLGWEITAFSLALGAWSAQIVLGRVFYAVGQVWVPGALGVAAMALALPVYHLGAGVGGPWLAFASSVAITLYTVALAVLARRKLGAIGGLLGPTLRMLPATALGIAAGLGTARLLGPPAWTTADALGRCLLAGGAGGLAYLAGCAISGVPELRVYTDRVLRRLRR